MDIYNVETIIDYNITEDQTLFRKQMLGAFNISIDNFDLIGKYVDKLYKDILDKKHLFTDEDYETFNKILIKLSSSFMIEDKDLGFMVLFSYDNFHLTHSFLKHLIIDGTVNIDILKPILDDD